MANAEGLLDQAVASEPYTVTALGPLIEFLQLAEAGVMPDPIIGRWLELHAAVPLVRALQSNVSSWIAPAHGRFAFARVRPAAEEFDADLTRFFMSMKRAATQVAGLPGTVPGQLAAALRELKGNILEHSDAASTGLLLYRAAPGLFEFVATDSGVGVLASLKSGGQFPDLMDHGEAMTLALQEGTSRLGVGKGRGFGFRSLFVGLLHLRSTLRFRSGDHALIMNGVNPTVATAQLVQKTPIKGFFISVRVDA